jgi:hypothetical protein
VRRKITDAPTATWEYFGVAVINLIFVGLLALALWPLEATALAGRLAKGYAILWGATALGSVTIAVAQQFLGIDDHWDINLLLYSNLAVAAPVMVCWSAFVALTVRDFAGETFGTAAPFYVAGFLSSFVGFMAVSAIFQGIFYKLVNLPLALACYVVFAFWPAAARFLFGWFFALF